MAEHIDNTAAGTRIWAGGRMTAEAAVSAVLALHRSSVWTLDSVDAGTGWQDVPVDSFDEIVNREELCDHCLKPAPCPTVQAIRDALQEPGPSDEVAP